MLSIADVLVAHPFFAGIDERVVCQLAGCSHLAHFGSGEYLFREGEAADRLFVLRRGRVSLDVYVPGREGVVATLDEGDVVGWSWLVPPYRWVFDARAVTEVSAVSVDAACLREKCSEDPALGYALMQRVAQVMYQRLQSTRIRMLDVYGTGHGR